MLANGRIRQSLTALVCFTLCFHFTCNPMTSCEKLHDMSRRLKGPQLSHKLPTITFCLADYVWVFTCSYDLLIHVLQGLFSSSGKMSYRQISRSLEATRLDYDYRVAPKFDSHLSSIASEVLGRLEKSKPESHDFITRSCSKTSVCLVKAGDDEIVLAHDVGKLTLTGTKS